MSALLLLLLSQASNYNLLLLLLCTATMIVPSAAPTMTARGCGPTLDRPVPRAQQAIVLRGSERDRE